MNAPFRLALTLTCALAASLAPRALAEPYFALETGSNCSACHVSPTGGGKRTAFGAAYGQTALSARLVGDLWDGTITPRFGIGGDARANVLGRRIPGQSNDFAFDLEEVLVYAEFKLLPEKLTLYVDERVAPSGATNREAYALFKWGKGMYARAGRMFLPFGWRIEDDSAFIRQVTGINYTTPDDGVEIGIDRPTFTANLAVTNGTAGAGEVDRGKQLSLRAVYVQPNWRIGGSYNYNDADAGAREMLGIFAGVKTGPVTWMAEVDLVEDESFATGPRDQVLGFAEANWKIKKGWNLKFTYEFFEPDDDVGEDDRNRASVLLEVFPMQFVQVTLGGRMAEGIPQSPQQNTDEVFLQLHTYF